MDDALQPDMCHAYEQRQKQLFERLQPDSEFEEHLVRQIVVCNYKLEQIQNRLTKAWCQINKIYGELKQDAKG